MTDLFEQQRKNVILTESPLATRMRPRHLDEFAGQSHLLGEGRVLRTCIERDIVPSVILWGPPGCGKTSLANIIANVTSSKFESLSAVSSGVSDLRKIIDAAKERRGMYGSRTILFLDEIHRFNKAQQDVVLPYVEDGTITLIGATTENPSFEVISPLISRCRIFALKPLDSTEILVLLRRALSDDERGIGKLKARATDEVLDYLIDMTDGDARLALNTLELAANACKVDSSGNATLDAELIEDAIQHKSVRYDKSGDGHYDTISAFIKSVRGSDPDASIYWLARMIEAGEDPMFIARRLVILASEDIGMADPTGLLIAVATQQSVHLIGMPEGAIPLAHATVYLATAPKSNAAYVALRMARDDVLTSRNEQVPMHLRNAVTKLMKNQGYGEGYIYPHDQPGHFSAMQNLPDTLANKRYYHPSDQGYEMKIGQRIREWRSDQILQSE